MTFVSTEGKCKSEEERKASAKIADERKAAENAKAILGWLMPSNARTDRIIFVLRNAANAARTATLTRLESKKALDSMRTEAATSLNQVCSLLDRGGLTQDAIKQADVAVAAWLSSLPRSKSRAAQAPAARVC
jgi:hypothetical protein